MNDLLVFAQKNIVFVAFLYLLWKVLLGFRGPYAYSRFYLISVLVLSLPVSLLTFSNPVFADKTIAISGLTALAQTTAPGSDNLLHNFDLVKTLYWSIVFIYLAVFSVKLFSVLRLAIKCTFKHTGNAKVCYSDRIEAPFSFGRWIFLPQNLRSQSHDLIIEHELSHIRYAHTLDVLVSELIIAVLWFNPFVYLLRKDLKLIHEIQADCKVLASSNVDDYMKLFIPVLTTGGRAIYSSFYSKQIKKRIVMMTQKNKASKLTVFAVTFVALVFSTIVPASAQQNVAVDKKAQFPGGNTALKHYIAEHVNYPDEARKKGYQDVVVVRFTITKNGKVKNPEVVQGKYEVLNQEAIRVVSSLPDFIPAEKNGKKVASQMEMPIAFKLD